MQINRANPVPSSSQRLLGVWAHPDDEAYLSSGLMADVVERGGEVTVVVMTDGELGFGDDDPRTVRGRSLLRRAEMREAMATIGVSDVRFIGVPDGFVVRMETESLVAPLVEIMTEIQPDLTATFGPEGITGHDDHIATGHVVTAAWLDHGGGALVYATHSSEFLEEWRTMHDELGIWMTGEPDGCDAVDLEFVVSLSHAALDRKRAVLACHGSQTAGLAAAMGEDQYRGWIAREFFRRPVWNELSAAVIARSAGIRWETLARREMAAVA